MSHNLHLQNEIQSHNCNESVHKTDEAQVRSKRKYTRRTPAPHIVAEDNTVIKPESKKRGRKRGRKKQEHDMLFKPEEILDYIQRNYPHVNIEKIRYKIIDGLKLMREFGERPYLLYKFEYDHTTYYYDDRGSILNTDGQLVGLFVKQSNDINKMFMFESKNKDRRTFQEVIDQIERRTPSVTATTVTTRVIPSDFLDIQSDILSDCMVDDISSDEFDL
jgi:hypothetical protein